MDIPVSSSSSADHSESSPELDLGDLLGAAVRRILEQPDAAQFLSWMAESGSADPLFASLPAADRRAAAVSLGLDLWNVFPLPDNNYRPRPLRLGRNDRCPCGSGQKLKQCCGSQLLAPREAIASEDVWALLLNEDPDVVQDAIDDGAVPRQVAPGLAALLLDQDAAESALELLEPLFEHPERLDERAEEALRTLLDAAREVEDHDDLVTRHQFLAARLRPALRYVLWSDQLLATRDPREARRLLTRARTDAADRLDLPMLELMVLGLEDRWSDAAELAAATAANMRGDRSLDEDEISQLLGLFDAAAIDPQVTLTCGPQVGPPRAWEPPARLLAWIRKASSQPIVNVEVVATGTGHFVKLVSSAAVAAAEVRWEAVRPRVRPGDEPEHDGHDHVHGDHDHGHDHDHHDHDGPCDHDHEHPDAWDDLGAPSWLAFLDDTAAAADSLVVIADLLRAIDGIPNRNPWTERLWANPLVERGTAMLAALDQLERPPLLQGPRAADDTELEAAAPDQVLAEAAWVVASKHTERVADHALAHPEALPAGRQRLMRYRDYWPRSGNFQNALVALLLTSGDADEAALAAIEQVDDEALGPDSLFGRALALFRLGQEDQALEALTTAQQRDPIGALLLARRLAEKVSPGEAIDEGSLLDALLGATPDVAAPSQALETANDDSEISDDEAIESAEDLEDEDLDEDDESGLADAASSAGLLLMLRCGAEFVARHQDLWLATPSAAAWCVDELRALATNAPPED